ncbi:hypothetical protein PGQ11_013462 [Apiospora arundinis]|uniref:Uncharacterized protein n=1 Tax=Apiospora arundinis TaxID=335852 RepID=A0ABR2HPE5_9PEZI
MARSLRCSRRMSTNSNHSLLLRFGRNRIESQPFRFSLRTGKLPHIEIPDSHICQRPLGHPHLIREEGQQLRTRQFVPSRHSTVATLDEYRDAQTRVIAVRLIRHDVDLDRRAKKTAQRVHVPLGLLAAPHVEQEAVPLRFAREPLGQVVPAVPVHLRDDGELLGGLAPDVEDAHVFPVLRLAPPSGHGELDHVVERTYIRFLRHLSLLSCSGAADF